MKLIDSDSLQRGLNGQEIHHTKPTVVIYKTSRDKPNQFKQAQNQYAAHSMSVFLNLLFIPFPC